MKVTKEILLSKFGQVFSSRPEGREAALSVIAYHLDKQHYDAVTIDFEGVLIMTPSWLSEFVQTLSQHGISEFNFKNDLNRSVKASIEILEEEKVGTRDRT